MRQNSPRFTPSSGASCAAPPSVPLSFSPLSSPSGRFKLKALAAGLVFLCCFAAASCCCAGESIFNEGGGSSAKQADTDMFSENSSGRQADAEASFFTDDGAKEYLSGGYLDDIKAGRLQEEKREAARKYQA